MQQQLINQYKCSSLDLDGLDLDLDSRLDLASHLTSTVT
jgi:hypothetical protein